MSPNQTPDPCRAEFEAGYFGNAPQNVKARERSGEGYVCMGPQAAWTTWQLAWKAAAANQAERYRAEVLKHQTTRAALEAVVAAMLPSNLRTPGDMARLGAPWPQAALALWSTQP